MKGANMISGIDRVKAKRMWFVPDFLVWGQTGPGQIEYLTLETINGEGVVLFDRTDLADEVQEVAFGDLIDRRGNSLPLSLECPRVVPRSRSGCAVFIAGTETATSFTIGHAPDCDSPTPVDLLIIEMGD
jgi:hypothetical protein